MYSTQHGWILGKSKTWTITLIAMTCLITNMNTYNAVAQTFDCGSDGSDGALSFDNPTTTTIVDWDPQNPAFQALLSPSRELDADNDGVYHFTTVVIPTNLTLRFRADKAGWTPIYWLCQGDVTIAGALDLSGEQGHPASDTEPGTLSMPGPGGYPGGWGRNNALGISVMNGFGPGHGGEHPGDNFLYPLTGGNGGNGGYGLQNDDPGPGGGGGGGAYLLASNTQIDVNGAVDCNGGQGGLGGYLFYGGAGGAIRMLAPIIQGAGAFMAKGGEGFVSSADGESGWIRLESETYLFTGIIDAALDRKRIVPLAPSAVYGLPVGAAQLPALRVVRIGGIEIPTQPGGTFEIPDAVLNTQDVVDFELEGNNVPLGTTVQFFLWSTAISSIEFESNGLTGTLDSSSAIASHTVPNGYTKGFFYAEWTNQ